MASSRDGTVAPSAMLYELSAHRRQNKLDLALWGLSRIKQTLFAL